MKIGKTPLVVIGKCLLRTDECPLCSKPSSYYCSKKVILQVTWNILYALDMHTPDADADGGLWIIGYILFRKKF
jgi:hypothetical protein